MFAVIDTYWLRAYFFRIIIRNQRLNELRQLAYPNFKALFYPADIALKLILLFFEKRFMNEFIHQLKEKHALMGYQFSIDHFLGGKN